MFNLIVSGLYLVMALVFLLKGEDGEVGFWACLILSTQHGMSAC